jgi:hypothetical protein
MIRHVQPLTATPLIESDSHSALFPSSPLGNLGSLRLRRASKCAPQFFAPTPTAEPWSGERVGTSRPLPRMAPDSHFLGMQVGKVPQVQSASLAIPGGAWFPVGLFPGWMDREPLSSSKIRNPAGARRERQLPQIPISPNSHSHRFGNQDNGIPTGNRWGQVDGCKWTQNGNVRRI